MPPQKQLTPIGVALEWFTWHAVHLLEFLASKWWGRLAVLAAIGFAGLVLANVIYQVVESPGHCESGIRTPTGFACDEWIGGTTWAQLLRLPPLPLAIGVGGLYFGWYTYVRGYGKGKRDAERDRQ